MRPEEKIEKRFVKKVEELGLRCYKFEVHGTKGAPDRMILIPGGRALYIEFKREGGGRVSPHQEWFIHDLKILGYDAHIFDNWQEPLELVKCRIKKSCSEQELTELECGKYGLKTEQSTSLQMELFTKS